jgi:hypothetical protein
VKGRLGFSSKTKSPSGATAGGIPPINGPIFLQKIHRKSVKYASTQILGELTRDASSQKAKKRESGIVYASSWIRPFPLAALPASYSCERNVPAKGSPKKMGRQDNTTAETNNEYFKLQISKCFKLFIT